MLEVLTGILVIITGSYAWATYKILRANEKVVEEMKEQSEAIMRPYIRIAPYVVPGTPLLGIRIANTGQSPAQNLTLRMNKDFYKFGEHQDGKNIARFKAFCETIDMFSAGAELIFDLAQGFKIFAEDADPNLMPRLFTITATYQFFGKKVIENNIIDLNPFEGSTQPRDLLLSELGNIRNSIEELVDIMKKKNKTSKI
ncbi:MAG: hypothetical protein WBW55_00245 [Desulfobaccales bacterium]